MNFSLSTFDQFLSKIYDLLQEKFEKLVGANKKLRQMIINTSS